MREVPVCVSGLDRQLPQKQRAFHVYPPALQSQQRPLSNVGLAPGGFADLPEGLTENRLVF